MRFLLLLLLLHLLHLAAAKPDYLLLAATGTQIKLYPFSAGRGPDPADFYLLKPDRPDATGGRRRSILPPDDDQENQENQENQGDQQRQRITELDYFFAADFCADDAQPADCLVVVWFDASARSVRLGAVRLDHLLAGPPDRRTPLRLAMLPDVRVGHACGLVKGLALERASSRLHALAAAPDGRWTLLTSQLGPNSSEPAPCRLVNRLCPGEPPAAIRSLGLSREGSLLLLEQFPDGARLSALQVGGPLALGDCRPISLGSNKSVGVLGASLLDDGAHLLWLTADLGLHQTQAEGLDAQLVARLPPRPTIGSVFAMQVMHDTLYLSDSMKKSLVAFALANQSAESRPAHQVLLVEPTGLYAFKLIDLELEVYLPQKAARQLFFVQLIFLLFVAGLIWASKKPNTKDEQQQLEDEVQPQTGGIYPSLAYEKLADGVA